MTLRAKLCRKSGQGDNNFATHNLVNCTHASFTTYVCTYSTKDKYVYFCAAVVKFIHFTHSSQNGSVYSYFR